MLIYLKGYSNDHADISEVVHGNDHVQFFRHICVLYCCFFVRLRSWIYADFVQLSFLPCSVIFTRLANCLCVATVKDPVRIAAHCFMAFLEHGFCYVFLLYIMFESV